jgi:DDE family transposase
LTTTRLKHDPAQESGDFIASTESSSQSASGGRQSPEYFGEFSASSESSSQSASGGRQSPEYFGDFSASSESSSQKRVARPYALRYQTVRGESENRHKELKRELPVDRLSDHRFLANYFRLLMHALAYNLLVRQRRLIADPPAVVRELDEDVAPPAESHRRLMLVEQRRQMNNPGWGDFAAQPDPATLHYPVAPNLCRILARERYKVVRARRARSKGA